MIVTNKPRQCAIEIQCTAEDFNLNALNEITAIRFKRASDEEKLVTIGELPISSQEDLSFTVQDITVRSNCAYKYYVIPVLGENEGVGAVGEVESKFSALFVGNLNNQYVCALNAKYTNKRHYSMNYVQTFYKKHPHAIQNGNMNYSSGSVTGLFLERDASGEFTAKNAQMYKERLIDFLTDGNWKIVKTGEGHMWYVQVDSEITEDYSDFVGASTITFNWTETAPVTKDGIVVVK